MTFSLIPFFLALGASVAFSSSQTTGKRLVGGCSGGLCRNIKEDLFGCFWKYFRISVIKNFGLILKFSCLFCIIVIIIVMILFSLS